MSLVLGPEGQFAMGPKRARILSGNTRRNRDERAGLERRHDERGAALVEAAFVLPLLILLILGIVEFGFMINRGTLVNNAAREGAREAIFGSSETEIEQRVLNSATNLDPSSITVTVTCLDPDGIACASYDDREPGGSAIVTVDYAYDFITPVTGWVGIGPTTNLSSTVEMRIEG